MRHHSHKHESDISNMNYVIMNQKKSSIQLEIDHANQVSQNL
jgi:hypothetical protein